MQDKSFFEVKQPSEKKFGFFFAIVFLLISLYLFYIETNLFYLTFLISLTLLISAIFFSPILKIPNKLWNLVGSILNRIVSPIIMLIIFLVTFFPIGIIIKLFKIDIIQIKYNDSLNSYWINRKDDIQDLRKLY